MIVAFLRNNFDYIYRVFIFCTWVWNSNSIPEPSPRADLGRPDLPAPVLFGFSSLFFYWQSTDRGWAASLNFRTVPDFPSWHDDISVSFLVPLTISRVFSPLPPPPLTTDPQAPANPSAAAPPPSPARLQPSGHCHPWATRRSHNGGIQIDPRMARSSSWAWGWTGFADLVKSSPGLFPGERGSGGALPF
jgi:hypothetical protein